MNLIPPAQIELDHRFITSGLYESFYFRGDSLDGMYSFWLKHNFMLFKNSQEVRVDNIFVLYSYENGKVQEWDQSKVFPLDQFFNMSKAFGQSWNQVKIEFEGQGFFEIKENKLQGRIPVGDKKIEWNFTLKKCHEAYYHFDKKWFYTGFFPKKKILTNDIGIKYSGKIETPDLMILKDSFWGMNGHNWGKEHAYLYAYADCNHFDSYAPGEIYFDGFCAKIKILNLKSPFLSCSSLKIKDQVYHFNSVLCSYQHRVKKLDLKNWKVLFFNKNYQLEVSIEGQEALWATLQYDHPNHKKSFVHNTKNARGEFYLKNKKGELLRHFSSSWVELETLIP